MNNGSKALSKKRLLLSLAANITNADHTYDDIPKEIIIGTDSNALINNGL